MIERLFRKEYPLKRFATIVKPIANGRYLVSDTTGRNYEVDANTSWNVGEGVTITDFRIVGRAAKFETPIAHEV